MMIAQIIKDLQAHYCKFRFMLNVKKLPMMSLTCCDKK
jgi:hypothetical protein